MAIVKEGKYYYYDFVFEGRRYRRSCKTTDRKIAEQIELSVKNDVILLKRNLPSNRNKRLLFQAAWETYLNNDGNPKESVKRKTTAAKNFLPFFKDKTLSDVLPLDIKNYQLHRKIEIMAMPKNTGKKDSEINFRSANYEVTIISGLYSFCIERGYVQSNPAAKIKKLNELSRLRTLSDDDIQKLVAGATNKLTKDLISFLIYTGCRKGEALNLKWEDVDLKNGVIAVKGTKTKYDRYIPVSEPLNKLLTNIEPSDKSPYIFSNRYGMRVKDFKDSFKNACVNAGLKNLRIHDLRHVFASKMVMNGTSLYITGELLGHRTTQMTKRYSHLVPDTLRKAVNDVWNKK